MPSVETSECAAEEDDEKEEDDVQKGKGEKQRRERAVCVQGSTPEQISAHRALHDGPPRKPREIRTRKGHLRHRHLVDA